jgi:hypothetical protein
MYGRHQLDDCISIGHRTEVAFKLKLGAEMALHRKRSNATDVKIAARKAFSKILKPLAELALNSGISVSELNSILRQSAILGIAAQQVKDANRINISGIAATTGISRSEISRTLKSSRRIYHTAAFSQTMANTILTAWYCDTRFLTAARQPRDLKMYGEGATFESLVKRYGRGIPSRAIFDELIRMGAIGIRGSQDVFPRMPMAIGQRLALRGISTIGAAVADLLNSTLAIGSHSADSSYIKRISGTVVGPGDAPAIRVKSLANAQTILNELQEALARNQDVAMSDSQTIAKVSVTVVYTAQRKKGARLPSKQRRNFRRSIPI